MIGSVLFLILVGQLMYEPPKVVPANPSSSNTLCLCVSPISCGVEVPMLYLYSLFIAIFVLVSFKLGVISLP